MVKKEINKMLMNLKRFMDFWCIDDAWRAHACSLYGMETMGKGLEKLSGGRLERILEKLTSNPIKGGPFRAGVTAIIQSSSSNHCTWS